MSRVQAIVAALVASFFIVAAAVAGPPSFTITVQVEPTGAGTVQLDPRKDAYKRNNIVNVTAVPSEGWRFDHWQGDLAGDTNPTTIRVAGDHAITAVFVEDGGGAADVSRRNRNSAIVRAGHLVTISATRKTDPKSCPYLDHRGVCRAP